MSVLKCWKPSLAVHKPAKPVPVITVEREAVGRTWRVIRDRILTRDCGLCQECKRNDRLRPACEVDHILPVWKGGTDDDGNLESLCHGCHATKTAVEQRERNSTANSF